MSQNKTLIQGLTPETNVNNKSGYANNGAPSDFYSQSSNTPGKGTVVPGMMGEKPFAEPNSTSTNTQQAKQQAQQGKPIVGFLYSISRTSFGEFWPLKIGRNTIGQNPKSDIVLSEATVTGDHAILVVRQIKNTGGVMAAITDTQSTNGTMINGETIGFTAVECHNGDVITIGNNYELVLLLVDAAKLNLSVSNDFIPVNVKEDENDIIPDMNNGSTHPFDPYNASWGGGGYVPNDGTVGLDGSTASYGHGKTIPL